MITVIYANTYIYKLYKCDAMNRIKLCNGPIGSLPRESFQATIHEFMKMLLVGGSTYEVLY